MKKERRKAIRISMYNSVANCRLLSVETGGKFQFTVWPVKNVSSGGVSIMSPNKIANGALAFLNIDLSSLLRTVGVISKVVWCRKRAAEKFEIGLHFSWWPKQEDKAALQNFVIKKLTSGEHNK